MAYPVWRTSQVSTVTGTSQEFTTGMVEGLTYVLSVSVGTWFKTAATGGTAAVGAADSHYIGAGGFRVLAATDATTGFVTVVKHTGEANGNASLSVVALP